MTTENIFAALEVKSAELQMSYYGQLQSLNASIAARSERPYPTREELGIIRQVTGTVRLLKAKSAIVIAMEAIMRFATKMQKAAPALTAYLLPKLCMMLLPGISLPDELGEALAGDGDKSSSSLTPTLGESSVLKPTLTLQDTSIPSPTLTESSILTPTPAQPSILKPALTESSVLKPALTLTPTYALEVPQLTTDAHSRPMWRGVRLDMVHPSGQTENGRTIEERMYYAKLRNDRRLMRKYIKEAMYMPLPALFGTAFDRREGQSGPLTLPVSQYSVQPHPADSALRMVIRPWKPASDGLPEEEQHQGTGGAMQPYWRGIPLSYIYPNGQTEAGRSLFERLYCARYRRSKGTVERILVSGASMDIIARFGRSLEST